MSIKKQLRKIGSSVTIAYNPSEKNFTVSYIALTLDIPNVTITLTNPSLKKALKELKSQVKSETKQSKKTSEKASKIS